jgi:hypothetical protein
MTRKIFFKFTGKAFVFKCLSVIYNTIIIDWRSEYENKR